MITMKECLKRKLKRERVEVCLNCKHFVRCRSIGEFVECAGFEEDKDKTWTTMGVARDMLSSFYIGAFSVITAGKADES